MAILAGAPWLPLSDPWQLWLNTALLTASSIALQWARVAARRGNSDGTWAGLVVGGFFAVALLLGNSEYGNNSGPAAIPWLRIRLTASLYLITGLHGLHRMGGLVAWGKTTAKVWRGAATSQVCLSVDLCTVYWHFLLVVWLVLFALLASSQETIGAFAAMCGLR